MAAKKLHVNYDYAADNIFLSMMTKCLSKAYLNKIMLKLSAPKTRPLDYYEACGEENTEIIEVETNKVWIVTHVRGGDEPKDFRFIGLSLNQENYDKIMDAATREGEEMVVQAEKDWFSLKNYYALCSKNGKSGEAPFSKP